MTAQLWEFMGGLGCFLYGLSLLSGGLTELGGSGLLRGGVRQEKKPHGIETLRPGRLLLWAGAGVGITAVLQSSGAVTVAAVEMAAAGLVPDGYAVALCWGSNLGTTATGQLLRLSQLPSAEGAAVRSVCCLAGGAGSMFFRGRVRAAGNLLFGLGLTFTGIGAVQAALQPWLAFAAWLARNGRPVSAFVFGTVLSAALQSSSGAVGLVQAAAAGGSVVWGQAVPLVAGINVGTCTTALAAAAVSRQKSALRVACGHIVFNLCGSAGVLLWMLLTPQAAFWRSAADFGGIANFHTLFNAATLAVLLTAAVLHTVFRTAPFGNRPLTAASGRNPAGRRSPKR